MSRLPLAPFLFLVLATPTARAAADPADLGQPLPPVPKTARLVLEEDWSANKIDPKRWYSPRRKWGNGNHGVTPDNLRLAPDTTPADTVNGKPQTVLVCEARGDRYDGPVLGQGGNKDRVGAMIVSRDFFASGRFEIVLKIGSTTPHPGGPADPRRPIGTIPAVWTYADRFVRAPRAANADDFAPESPLYNPLMKRNNRGGGNQYWSELDFPEFGKAGNFDAGLYNTFCQNRHEPKTFDVSPAIDGQYHTLTTVWRTKLAPLENVTDAQTIESAGFFWIRDKSIDFDRYLGNPLKRLGKDRYAVYAGDRVDHWLDGKKVAQNTRYVPAMAAQLTLGIWLPDWAGPAPWQTATVSFASVKVWQYDDEGDVRGILTRDCPDNFDKDGRPLR
jgi:hypothetical protein